MSKRVVLLRCALLSTVAVINSACSSIDRLKAIGEQPLDRRERGAAFRRGADAF